MLLLCSHSCAVCPLTAQHRNDLTNTALTLVDIYKKKLIRVSERLAHACSYDKSFIMFGKLTVLVN